MKKLKINTGKATILAVELPKDATDVTIGTNCLGFKSEKYTGNKDTNGFFPAIIGLGFGKDWKVLTPDEYKNVVQCVLKKGQFSNHDEWRDYADTDVLYGKTFDNAKDSFNSLLRANGVVTVNPYDHLKAPTSNNDKIGLQNYNQWQQTESQLWENVYILVKVD
jgi:hypothetical protein